MKFKKILIFLFVLCLFVSIFSVVVLAAEPNDIITLSTEPDGGVLDWLKSVWKNITDLYDLLVDVRNKIVNSVSNVISSGFSGLWNYLDGFVDKFNSIISVIKNHLTDTIKVNFLALFDYLGDVYDKLNQLTSLITNHLTDSFVNGLISVRDYVVDIYNKLFDLYNVVSIGIEDKLVSLRDSILNLPQNVANSFKQFFVVDVDELELIFTDTIDQISSKLGISSVSSVALFDERSKPNDSVDSKFDQISDVFSSEEAPGNITKQYYIPGLKTFSFTFVDYKYLISAVDFFRPLIRAFLYILLILFHVSQIMSLIKQQPVSVGRGAVNLLVTGNSSEGGK